MNENRSIFFRNKIKEKKYGDLKKDWRSSMGRFDVKNHVALFSLVPHGLSEALSAENYAARF